MSQQKTYTAADFQKGRVPGTRNAKEDPVPTRVAVVARKHYVLSPTLCDVKLTLSHAWPTCNAIDSMNVRNRARFKKRAAEAFLQLVQGLPRPSLPVRVTFSRIGEGDDDNIERGMKPLRDRIAEWLGVDDGDKTKVRWAYEDIHPVAREKPSLSVRFDSSRDSFERILRAEEMQRALELAKQALREKALAAHQATKVPGLTRDLCVCGHTSGSGATPECDALRLLEQLRVSP